MDKNNVIFKGVPNGILVILDSDIPFDELRDSLLKKVKSAKAFFSGANISISFKGRELTEDEEFILLDIISRESGLDISFVNNLSPLDISGEGLEPEDVIKKVGEKAGNKWVSSFVEHKLQDTILTNKSNITHFHKGSIRSGQKLRFDGSIVIVGDINPGGQVLAEGNIIVLGRLKGFVHAGCKGDASCFVSALQMSPSQVFIGDFFSYFPSDMERDLTPRYAYVKEGEIYIEPLI